MSSAFNGPRSAGVPLLSRRRFVQGLAVGGAVAAFGSWPRGVFAATNPVAALTREGKGGVNSTSDVTL